MTSTRVGSVGNVRTRLAFVTKQRSARRVLEYVRQMETHRRGGWLLGFLVLAAACTPSTSTPSSAPASTAAASLVRASESPMQQPSATASPTQVAAPTCVPQPTSDNAEPSHAPVNGIPDLGVPVLRGVILVQVAQCRDIADVLRKYGLTGSAAREIPGVMSPESAARWYRVPVTVGTESQTVVLLHQHPEDIDYVQLIPVPPQPAVSTQPP